MSSIAMLVDTSKCTAWRGCQIACKQWWDLAATRTKQTGSYENPRDLSPETWSRVTFNEYEAGGKLQWLFLNLGCMHCTQAACADVCPTGALQHNDTGFVSLDREQCNGCGYCVEACPFRIPRLDVVNTLTGEAKASKCTLCQDRVTNGLTPACVKTCPPGALQFGDRTAMLSVARKRVDTLKAQGVAQARTYGETELGGLGRLYVLTAPPTAYGLPEAPEYPALVNLWHNLAQPLGYAGAGLMTAGLAVNWLLTRRARLSNVEEK